MGKFTKIPEDTFEKLVLNAGILVDEFNPENGEIGRLLGSTTGGISFSSNPSYTDFGEDIDNCPNNTMELKRIEGYDPAMSGTFLTVDAVSLKRLAGAADVVDEKQIVPRNYLLSTDFADVWWVGDYSDKNTGDKAGYLAIHLMNALNTSGIQITSGKNAKGQMAFDFHGHVSISSQDIVPFELYCQSGEDSEANE